MDRLPRQTCTQGATVPLNHANAASHVVQKLVTSTKRFRGHSRPVVLQADPTGDNDWGSHNQLKYAKIFIVSPVVVMQKGPPFHTFTSRPVTWCCDKGFASRQCPFWPRFSPIAATARNISVISSTWQAKRPLTTRDATC